MSTFTVLIHCVLEILARAIRKVSEIKDIQIGKKKVKKKIHACRWCNFVNEKSWTYHHKSCRTYKSIDYNYSIQNQQHKNN